MKAIKSNKELLTKEQIKEAKSALNTILKLKNRIEFIDDIEDLDGHTGGLAYEAHDTFMEFGDKIYGLLSIVERIENFGK